MSKALAAVALAGAMTVGVLTATAVADNKPPKDPCKKARKLAGDLAVAATVGRPDLTAAEVVVYAVDVAVGVLGAECE